MEFEDEERISRQKALKIAERRIERELPAFQFLESIDTGLEPNDICIRLRKTRDKIKKVEGCIKLQLNVSFSEKILLLRRKVDDAEKFRRSAFLSRAIKATFELFYNEAKVIKEDIERICIEEGVDPEPYVEYFSVLCNEVTSSENRENKETSGEWRSINLQERPVTSSY